MDKLDAMNAFVRVVSSGSFAQAGRSLGLTRSAVSKAVMELEQSLGVRLLDRTTRRVNPTEAGLAYYESSADVLARVEEIEMQVSRLHDEPRGVLKINAPMSFGAKYLAELLPEFMASYPDLKIELTLNDRVIDPIEEGMDVTVRIGILPASSLIARRLAPARRVLVAAPSYLDSYGTPQSLDELKQHRALSYGYMTTLHRWELMHDGKVQQPSIHAILCSNNGDVLRSAALAGQGIAKLPTFIVGPDIRDGRLRLVLPDYPPTELGIYALYAPNRYLAAKVRLIVDFLARHFGHEPAWDHF